MANIDTAWKYPDVEILVSDRPHDKKKKKKPTELLTFNQILISKSFEEFYLVFLLECENTASDSGKEQSVSNTPGLRKSQHEGLLGNNLYGLQMRVDNKVKVN